MATADEDIERRAGHLGAFTRSVTHNLLVDGCRKRPLALLDDLFPKGHPDCAAWMGWRGDGPLDDAVCRETCESLAQAMGVLTPNERFVIIQYYYEELTDGQIAELLLSSPGLCQELRVSIPNEDNVKRTRWRAIEKLRDHVVKD